MNLITLTEKQLEIRVLARYGLRESLFFVLFGYLEVFDTTNNMFRARNSIRTNAVSLDGGLIRARNQFDLGSRYDFYVLATLCTFPEFDLTKKPCLSSVMNQLCYESTLSCSVMYQLCLGSALSCINHVSALSVTVSTVSKVFLTKKFPLAGRIL